MSSIYFTDSSVEFYWFSVKDLQLLPSMNSHCELVAVHWFRFKENSYKQIAEFENNWFIFQNWKRLSYRESFPWKSDSLFIRITSFFKIWYEAIRKKVAIAIAILKSKIIYFCWALIFVDELP